MRNCLFVRLQLLTIVRNGFLYLIGQPNPLLLSFSPGNWYRLAWALMWQQWTNSHGLPKPCREKGTAWPLSKWQRVRGLERAQETLTPAWTGFYCFSGHITSRIVLIYYAQVHWRWLPFTDNKGQNAANYFKEKDVTDQRGKWLNWLYSILGRFSTDFRKLKILSKHLLPQSRVREF